MNTWSAALLGAAAVAACGSLLLRLQRLLGRRKRRAIQRSASAAERAAQKLLNEHGYRIEAVHPPQSYVIECDGEAMSFKLRADLLVRRGGRRYVADVKAGALVTSLRHGPTRRQLLEYAVAYRCSGVLLVDMHQRAVHEIAFPLPSDDAPEGRASRWFRRGLVAIAVTLVLGSALQHYRQHSPSKPPVKRESRSGER